MSTFLQLCQSWRSEAGLSGTGPASVLGQSGIYARGVEWVAEAYAEILRMHPWSFLWTRATPALTGGLAEYAGADFSPAITDLGEVFVNKVYDTTSSGTPRIYYRSWDEIDRQAAASGAPRYFTRRPDGKLVFHPTPDAAYTLKLDYQSTGTALTADADVPAIPDASLHKIIVYKALQYYGLYDENQTAFLHGQKQFDMLLGQMHAKYGRQILTAPIPMGVETNPNGLELV